MIKTVVEYSKIYDKILHDKNAEIVSFGISDSYVPKWTEINSLTEYIANFYDESNVNFTIKHTNKAVILEDNSERGIKLEDLAFGNSRSSEVSYKIGTHGEGFKLGALALIRENKKVLIDTIGHTFIFLLEYDASLNSKILKAKIIKNQRLKGTTVYLETDKLEEAKEKFLFLNDKVTKINDMLYINKNNKENYIFVNTLASQKISSLFSYSLHKKQKVNRDRNMLESPYHDIALSLFSTKDKNILKEWLLSLQRNFENLFEEELILYVMENLKKSEFKNMDFSLLQQIAKEENISFIRPVYNKNIYRYLIQDKQLIFSRNYTVANFFNKIVNCEMKYSEIPFTKKVGDYYYLPIDKVANYGEYHSSQQRNTSKNIFQLVKNHLPDLRIMDNFSVNENIIKFSLKDLDKINMLTGKNQKDDNVSHRISSLFGNLSVLKENGINISNWSCEIQSEKQFPNLLICKFTEIPNIFELTIPHNSVMEELKTNLYFTQSKQIINRLVYKLESQQYTFSEVYLDKMAPLENSLFSYRDKIADHHLSDIFGSTTILKEIFTNIHNVDKMEYDLSLLKRFYLNYLYRQHNYWVDDLRKIWSKAFKDVFGNRSCISVSPNDDKKAVYNGYKVIDMPNVIQEMFLALKIELSSSVINIGSHKYDIIQKPLLDDLNKVKNSPYYRVFYCLFMLNEVLKDVYLLTKKYEKDSRLSFISKLLPTHLGYSRLSLNSTNLNDKNYSKAVQEFCFNYYDKIFIVNEFDEDINGCYFNSNVYVKNNEKFIGTFFHESIHLLTGLKDIDIEFEKMLSFMNIMGQQPKKKASTKNVERFFSAYQKWLRV